MPPLRAVACCLVLLGAGCSTGSPAPSVEAPAVTRAVDAYYAAVDQAIRGGRTEPLTATTSASCSCRKLITFFADTWRHGSITGGTVTARLGTVHVQGASATVRAAVTTGAMALLDAHGHITKRLPAGSSTSTLTLVRDQGRWLVESIVRT